MLFYTYGAYVTQEVSEDLTPPPQYLKFQTIDLLLVGVAWTQAANSYASLEVWFFFFLVSIRAE